MYRKTISITIPVYNNQGSLDETHSIISSLFKKDDFLKNYNYEIVFVNDGSKDNSLNKLLELRSKDSNVKVVELSRNFGQGEAIIAGHHNSTGDAVITVSADLQDPLELIKEMVQAWSKGNEVVVGYRETREDSFLRSFTSRIYIWLINTEMRVKMPPGGFDFWLLDRQAQDAMNQIHDKIRGLHYDIYSLGFNINLIPYHRKKRFEGQSQYNFLKRVHFALHGYLSISFAPIRFMTFFGMSVAFFGFLYALTIIIAWFFNNTPFNGWAPIMVLLLIIGGIIIVMLGLVGEYIWRIYEEIKKRPNHIIKKIHK